MANCPYRIILKTHWTQNNLVADAASFDNLWICKQRWFYGHHLKPWFIVHSCRKFSVCICGHDVIVFLLLFFSCLSTVNVTDCREPWVIWIRAHNLLYYNSRILFEKLIIAHLVNKLFRIFYGTRSFIKAFNSVLNQLNPVHIAPPSLFKIHYNAYKLK